MARIRDVAGTGVTGVIAALGASASWALGSVLFRRVGDDVSPVAMNLGKAVFALTCLGATLAWVGWQPVDARTMLCLAGSGLVGIAIGDTLFFSALVSLGPRLTVLFGGTGPILTVLAAISVLHERVSWTAGVGIVATLTGMSLATWGSLRREAAIEALAEPVCAQPGPPVAQRASPGGDVPREPAARRMASWAGGLMCAVLAPACMAIGTILARLGIVEAPVLQGTFIRMLAAVGGLGLWGAVTGRLGVWLDPFRREGVLTRTVVAGGVVVFGGFCLTLLAIKQLGAALSGALLSTEPLFVLPLSVVAFAEPVSATEVAGFLLGVAGVVALFLR